MRGIYRTALWLVGWSLLCGTAQGAVNTWISSGQAGTQRWDFAVSNWSLAHIPLAGEDVVITAAGANVQLTAATPALASLTLNRTITFTNWTTSLQATNVTIQSGGMMTCGGPYSNGFMSNRVFVICSNMTIDAGGSINVNARGYAAANAGLDGQGPGGGIGAAANYGSGPGYGGRGGRSETAVNKRGGYVYGSVTNPVDPGSGGSGSSGNTGGAGGGAVRIQATGLVTVNGTITADGGVPGGVTCTGGSGGGVWIDCNTFAGINGVIQAQGKNYGNWPAGAGGGGRIAINYNVASQAGMPKPSVRFNTMPGYGWGEYGGNQRGWIFSLGQPYGADIGTLAFPDYSLLDPTNFNHIGEWRVPGISSLSFDSLTISNAWIRFPVDGLTLTVTNDFRVIGGATMARSLLEFGRGSTNELVMRDLHAHLRYDYFCFSNGPIINVGGNLGLSNAVLFFGFGESNVVGTDYEALLSVTGTVVIGTNSWLIPFSHPTNGVTPLLQMSNLVVLSGGGINAEGRGYAGGGGTNVWFLPTRMYSGWGPGGGVGGQVANYTAGGGHGGRGGMSSIYYMGGLTYGSVTNPVQPGGGGGGSCYANNYGASGGGMIRIQAQDQVVVNGVINAGGARALNPAGYSQSDNTYGGGGGGGSVNIQCRTFSGTGGVVWAKGGDAAVLGNGGGGGGGRIAVYYDTTAQSALPKPAVTFNTKPGQGYPESSFWWGVPFGGDLGTLYFPDNQLFDETWIGHYGQWMAQGLTNLSVSSLTISNAWIRFPVDGFSLTVTNTLAIIGGAGMAYSILELGSTLENLSGPYTNKQSYLRYGLMGFTSGPVLNCGNLVLTNFGRLYLGFGAANFPEMDYGSLLNVSDSIIVASNCWIQPYSNPSNGVSPLLMTSNLFINAYGGVDASGLGYAGGINLNYNGLGPGGGGGANSANYGAGGAYAGNGGAASSGAQGGSQYGSSNRPIEPGSGAGGSRLNTGSGVPGEWGGSGGGSIRIQASGQVVCNGLLLANGTRSPFLNYSGGGAGGGVFVACNSFSSTGGAIRANASSALVAGQGGGGGGGRIAVWRAYEGSNLVACAATGGVGLVSGGTGTVVWGWTPVLRVGTNVPTARVMKGSSVTNASFSVWNVNAGRLGYTVSDDAAWMSVAPAMGISAGEQDAIACAFDATSLASGAYTGRVTVAGVAPFINMPAFESPQTVQLILEVMELKKSLGGLTNVVMQGCIAGSQSFQV
ncbi:MAG: hypothetical protein HY343_06225, partial [Lentisphaerae bacterium]|nr:hypothetical protein [Lentisphaerota bacterium]